MKLAFFDDNKLDYTPDTPFERPLGGAESTAAYLTAALASCGHDITLINQSSQPGVHRGVKVTGRTGARADHLNAHDAVVVMTRPMGRILREGGVRVPLIYWQHKAATSQEAQQLRDPAQRDPWNAVVYVSDQQRDAFIKRFGLDGVVLRNAASPAALAARFVEQTFIDRGEDPTLIYASAPGHGLELLLASFAVIRETLPGARLRICSDGGLYQQSKEDDPYSALYALARALPGVEFTGSVSQTQLGVLMSQSDILAYPTIFMETSCIVAIEAAAAGCLYVGNDYGPLRETLAGYGHFTPAVDSRTLTAFNVAKLAIEAVGGARADPEAYRRGRAQQSAWFRQTHTWDRRAAEWETYLAGLLGRAA